MPRTGTQSLYSQLEQRAASLSKNDRKCVQRIFGAASKAARAYDGSPLTEETAFTALADLEKLRRAVFPGVQGHENEMLAERFLCAIWGRNADYTSDDLLDVMARAASPENRQGKFRLRRPDPVHGHRENTYLPAPFSPVVERKLMDVKLQAVFALCAALERVRDRHNVQQTPSPLNLSPLPDLAALFPAKKTSQTSAAPQAASNPKTKPEKALPYDLDVVNDWVRQSIREKRHVLTATDEQIPGAPQGETGKKLNNAISQKYRGTAGFDARNLVDFLHKQHRLGAYRDVLEETGLSAFEVGIRYDYERDWLNQRIITELRTKGRVPGPESGPVPDAERGETWKTVCAAFRWKTRGTIKFGVRNLAGFILQQYHLGVYEGVLKEKGLSLEQAGIVQPPPSNLSYQIGPEFAFWPKSGNSPS